MTVLAGRLRRVVVAAGVAAGLVLAPGLPAPAAAAAATVTDDRFQRVSAAVAGSLQGGAEGATFAALVDGFAFNDDSGSPAASASTDFFFGSIECLTDSSDVEVRVGRRLGTATLSGTTTGTCFDFATGVESTFAARFSLTWAATGRLEVERTGTRTGGTVCRTMSRTREATAAGTLTWSAPQLRLAGTGAPTAAFPVLDRRDHCVTPHPGP